MKIYNRDGLFAEALQVEAERALISTAATYTKDGRMRELMFINAKKAHINPLCDQDVYIQLPEEDGCPPEVGSKLALVIWI